MNLNNLIQKIFSNFKRPRILIIGGGCVGLTLNALFRLNNIKPIIIARNYSLEYFSKNKTYNFSSEMIDNCKPFQIPICIKNANYHKKADYIFICVRATEINSILKIIKFCSKKETIIIPLVTGYGYTDLLTKKLKTNNIIYGYADGPFLRDEIFSIKQIGNSGFYYGYKSEDFPLKKKLEKLKVILDNFKIPCKLYSGKEILYKVYKKNCFNSILSITGFIYKKNLGEILSDKEAFDFLKDLTKEQSILAEKLSIKDKEEFYNEIINEIQNWPKTLTSSVLESIKTNNIPEIFFILFYIVELAEKYKIELPIYKKLTKDFHSWEKYITSFI